MGHSLWCILWGWKMRAIAKNLVKGLPFYCQKSLDAVLRLPFLFPKMQCIQGMLLALSIHRFEDLNFDNQCVSSSVLPLPPVSSGGWRVCLCVLWNTPRGRGTAAAPLTCVVNCVTFSTLTHFLQIRDCLGCCLSSSPLKIKSSASRGIDRTDFWVHEMTRVEKVDLFECLPYVY